MVEDRKLTLTEFLEHYSGAPFDDAHYASVMIDRLPEDLLVVKAAHSFLEAKRMFEIAMKSMGLERD
jgi:hypothetical protein